MIEEEIEGEMDTRWRERDGRVIEEEMEGEMYTECRERWRER